MPFVEELRFGADPIADQDIALRRLVLSEAFGAKYSIVVTDTVYNVPGYELEYPPVGEGGFGRVFRARKSGSETIYAVKVIDPSAFVDRDKSLLRFNMEVAALARLDHPCIVRYVESGVTLDEPAVPFLVTEFVDGRPFSSAVDMSEPERIQFLVAMLKGLQASHEMGIIHRDIKPSNVFCRTETMTPAILDFGLVFDTEDGSRISVTSRYAGSIGYIPPEVISGEESSRVNHDVYSAGVLMYEAFSGKRPNMQTYVPLSSIRAEWSSLDPIVQRAVGPANSRFRTASEFSIALKDVLAGLQIAASLKEVNPIADDYRRKAIDKRNRAKAQQEAREQAQAKADRVWREFDTVVRAGAEKAFEDMLIVAKDVNPAYAFEKVQHGTDSNAEVSLELTGTRENRIVFAAARPERGVAQGSDKCLVHWPTPQPPSRAVYPTSARAPSSPSSRLLPEWVVYTEAQHSRPRQIVHGAMCVCEVDRVNALYAMPLTEWHGSTGQRSQYPIRLQSAEDVRRYVTNVIGEALGLNHG